MAAVQARTSASDAAADGAGGTAYRVAYVTAPVAEAPQLAAKIVDSRLAACVNIIPSVQSVYHWDGAVQSDEESLMIIKTQAALQDDLTAFVQEAHSYDVPEVIFLPIQAGSLPYLQWIGANTRAPTAEGASASTSAGSGVGTASDASSAATSAAGRGSDTAAGAGGSEL